MKNNTLNTIIRSLFGKSSAIAFFTAFLAIASYAQTNNLYYQQGGAYFGQVTVFPGSHFEISTNGTVIKTFRNSCRAISGNGVFCTFGQFRGGQHIFSGEAQFFQNGIVYLRWTNENVGGTWRQTNGAWIGFRP